MLDSAFFTAIVDAMNPFKIIGTIRNALSPTLNFIDWQLGYEDFESYYYDKVYKEEETAFSDYIYELQNDGFELDFDILSV